MNKEAIRRFLIVLLTAALPLQAGTDDGSEARMRLLDEIQADIRGILGRELRPQVAAAVKSVPRHEFVPKTLQSNAYANHPLPIGDDQTISQPLIVALMTDLMDVDKDDRVLEVGTGSGYQAAVLAEIADHVYSVEIIGALAHAATGRLKRLGYLNVSVRHGDGLAGWPEAAPFDAIMVTAAGVEIPESLLEQLKPGGRLVIPVGAEHAVQQLKVIEKTAAGITSTDVLPVRFVPVTRTVR